MIQKKLLYLFLGVGSFWAYGISFPCCGTDSPRILASMQELRQLDFSLTTSFKEVYARYDSQGNLSQVRGPSDLAFQLTSVIRLNPQLEMFGRLPFIFRSENGLSPHEGSSQLGDLLLGFRRIVYESLYLEDPLPTVSFLANLKVPTGLSDLGTQSPKAWEPFVGIGLQKERFQWLGNMDLGLSVRENEILFRGSQSLGYGISQPVQLGLGSQQIISLNASQKVFSLLSFAHWSLDQFTVLGAQIDWSLPLEGFGANQVLTRTASVSLRYTFF